MNYNDKALEVLKAVAHHMREGSRENEPVSAIATALREANKAGFDEARQPAPLDADF